MEENAVEEGAAPVVVVVAAEEEVPAKDEDGEEGVPMTGNEKPLLKAR